MFNLESGSVLYLAYGLIKWLLIGWLVVASRIWSNTLLAVMLGIGVLIIGVGTVFKIEHWVFADELMVAGAALAGGAYGLWFRAKAQRHLLDYLKLAWVIGALAAVVASALFPPAIKSVAGGAEMLFWAMALRYIYQRSIRKAAPGLD